MGTTRRLDVPERVLASLAREFAVFRAAVWARMAQHAGAVDPHPGYMLDDERIFIPAPSMSATAGTATAASAGASTVAGVAGYALAATGTNAVGLQLMFPRSWASFNAYVWWTRDGTEASAKTVWDTSRHALAAGETIAMTTTTDVTVAPPAQYVIKRTLLSSGGGIAVDEMYALNIRRLADADADTFTGSVIIVGVELEKAS